MWPWDPEESKISEYQEIALCSGAILSIRHSYDYSFLFVACEDGQFFILNMKEVQQGTDMENLYEYRRHDE